MKLKRLLSCGLICILAGTGILLGSKVANATAFPFKKVTDASTLEVGDIISIVNEGNNAALSTTQNSNNRKQTTISITNKTFNSTADVQEITLEKGSVDGTFAFNVGNEYLFAAGSGSGKNHLKTGSSIDGNASWNITISKGDATIKASGDNTNNWLRYNSSNSIFSCYKSGQAPVQIYRLDVVLYNVTFNSNGGSDVASQKVKENDIISVDNPTREGYVFDGWYTDEALTNKYDLNTHVTANLTLYAKWNSEATLPKHTITFISEEKTYDTTEVVDGKSITAPTEPTREGYVFDGWYTDANCTEKYSFDSLVNQSFNLYAKWLTICTVTFNTNGGSTINPQEVTAGNKAKNPKTPTKEGFRFVDWYLDETFTTPFDFDTTTITENITLYALFIDLNTVIVDGYEFERINTLEELTNGLYVIGSNSSGNYKFTNGFDSSYIKAGDEPCEYFRIYRNGNKVQLKFGSEYVETSGASVSLGSTATSFNVSLVESDFRLTVGTNRLSYNAQSPRYKMYSIDNSYPDLMLYKAKDASLSAQDKFESLEIKNQLSYHWSTTDGKTYTIDNVSLRFGVELTEAMTALEEVKFGAFVSNSASIIGNIETSIAKGATTAAAVVVDIGNTIGYLEFANIAASGGMTSIRIDHLDNNLTDEIYVVIYMEYNGKLYITAEKVASVKSVATDYLDSDDIELTQDQKNSLGQIAK